MMLKVPPKDLYENKNLHIRKNYKDIRGNIPRKNIVIHPCFVVFSKKDMKENTWLFDVDDKDAIMKMKDLKNFNGCLIPE